MDAVGTLPGRLGWWWIGLGVAAVALAAVGIPLLAAVYEVIILLAFVLGMAQAAALPLALLRPRLAAALVVGSTLVFSLVTAQSSAAPWPVPVVTLIVTSLLLLVLSLAGRWRLAVGTLCAMVATALLAMLLHPPVDGTAASVDVVLLCAHGVVVIVAGVLVNQRAALRTQLVAAQRQADVEAERRMVVEERARIARDLHDIVAHSMSVVQMQARSAPYRLSSVDDATRAEFEAIADTARAALGEMRGMLGVLRDETDAAATAPQPGLDRIPELVESARRAGGAVDLHLAVPDGMPPTVQTTAYRIVQEGLANVARHAPGAAAVVRVAFEGGVLSVEVVNDAPIGVASADEGGHGLIGMRERAGALGGTLVHGATPEGGYRVRAELPVAAVVVA